MTAVRAPNRWLLVLIPLLMIVIVAGGVSIWQRFPRSQPVEILLPSAEKFQGDVYIGGAVANPGSYPVRADDSISSLIQSAGGFTTAADNSKLSLVISQKTSASEPQKININRADEWLLKALPDIGDTRAKAIIEYRNKNGEFYNIYQMTRVEGISSPTYEKIKDLITVGD